MAKRGTSTEKTPKVRSLIPLGQCRMRERRNATLIRVSLCHVAFHTIMSSEISDITRQSIAIHKLRGVSESPKDSYQHLISRGDAHQQPELSSTMSLKPPHGRRGEPHTHKLP